MIKRLTAKDLDRIVDAGVKAAEGIKDRTKYYEVSNKAGLDKFDQLIKNRKEVDIQDLIGKKCTCIKTPLMYHPGNSYRIIDSDVWTIKAVTKNGTMVQVETDEGIMFRVLTGTIKGVVIW